MTFVVFLTGYALSSLNDRRIVKDHNVWADDIAANDDGDQRHTNDEGCDKMQKCMMTTWGVRVDRSLSTTFGIGF